MSYFTVSSPINILGNPPEHDFHRKRLTRAFYIIGHSFDCPSSICIDDPAACSDEELLATSADSDTSSVIDNRSRRADSMRHFEALEREIRLEIREEEMESRIALANARMYAWQLQAQGPIKKDGLNGYSRALGLEDMTWHLAHLVPAHTEDRELAVLPLGQQLLRVQLQAEAEHGMCLLLHQAIAGIEQIMDQKHFEHASRLENYQRMANEKLRQSAATNALMEDRGRELSAALQEEQRLRMESDQTVKYLKQVHQHMVGVQEQLVQDLEIARSEIMETAQQVATLETQCLDLQHQVEGHKALEQHLYTEIQRLELTLPAPGAPAGAAGRGCTHQ
eukprot:GGOE01008575.1.p1 GENE.GGOE01008575.1~~GGOE01008575.1.p1  ORF type:complete len:336 (+),score=78.04 GGOE01008575.1:108-1115(+)